MNFHNRTKSIAQPPPNLLVVHRLSDRLATLLSDQISSGSLRPGDRLPTERELSSQLEVSRAVVRDAVKVLGAAGLVQAKQGQRRLCDRLKPSLCDRRHRPLDER